MYRNKSTSLCVDTIITELPVWLDRTSLQFGQDASQLLLGWALRSQRLASRTQVFHWRMRNLTFYLC